MAYILLLLYLLAFTLFSSQSVFVNALGIIPLYVSSVVGSYKLHDYLHYDAQELKEVGRIKFMLVRWISNSIYFDFNDLRILHSRHHKLMIDNEVLPNSLFNSNHFSVLSTFISFLEFLYVPIVSYIQFHKLINIVLKESSYNVRLLSVIIIKIFILVSMLCVSSKSLVFCAIGSILQINTLRFFDAFQHVYESFHVSQSPRRKSFEYEKKNTYTLVFPSYLEFIQVFILNFNMHNAHHLFPKVRWNNLPKINNKILDEYRWNHIPIGVAVSLYHKNRVKRLFCGQGTVSDDEDERKRYLNFYGASTIPFIYGFYRYCKN
jgi:acyl-lipid omega-6 desaturase (Delta-12 desaturase)